MSPTAAAAVRVVSYNVLSSHLSTLTDYPTLKPEHLEATTRLAMILNKLEHEIGSSENRAIIFCLQEISYDWAGALHTFFARHNYHVITGLYGKKSNGYMGVLTAYPTDKLETVQVDICRLSDTYEQWPEKSEEGTLYKEVPESHWSIAQHRYNVLLTVVLKDKSSSQQFCVGNYHMPCYFDMPMVMTLHSDLYLRHVQKIACHNPYILAGDFNFAPTDSPYKLLTTGELATSDPSYPTPPLHCPEFIWKPTLGESVQSAYAIANGVEPDFTNHSRWKEEESYIETLDYIFISDGVKVQSVLELPHRDVARGPFPNESEPSDHILIAANLDVGSRSSSSATEE